jgi:hypothetical protein
MENGRDLPTAIQRLSISFLNSVIADRPNPPPVFPHLCRSGYAARERRAPAGPAKHHADRFQRLPQLSIGVPRDRTRAVWRKCALRHTTTARLETGAHRTCDGRTLSGAHRTCDRRAHSRHPARIALAIDAHIPGTWGASHSRSTGAPFPRLTRTGRPTHALSQNSTQIFPKCWPDSSYRKASASPSSGKLLSIIGLSPPASIPRTMSC